MAIDDLFEVFLHLDDFLEHWRLVVGVALILAGIVAIWFGVDGGLAVPGYVLYASGGAAIVAGIWMILKHVEKCAA